VLTGQVVVSIGGDGLQTAEAIGIADDQVVAVGSRDEVLELAAPGARMVAAGKSAIIPGVHDFHLHLVGMARARRTLRLDGVVTFEALLAELRRARAALVPAATMRAPGAASSSTSSREPTATTWSSAIPIASAVWSPSPPIETTTCPVRTVVARGSLIGSKGGRCGASARMPSRVGPSQSAAGLPAR
ncbi:MAG: hypothetical protein M3P32_01040, partial [Chloroflexota bacterium]|nr:hypothetical protein [Chloroflexota bacterium]